MIEDVIENLQTNASSLFCNHISSPMGCVGMIKSVDTIMNTFCRLTVT